MERPSWLEYFKQLTILTASRSPCSRLKVGCLLVKDNRIISQGYNGFLPGSPHDSILFNNHEQATVHAEQNAITDCAKRGVSSNNCDAYITHYPCINCMKILCASGIKTIYYINDYNNDPIVERFKTMTNTTIVKI
jgi:dCMP deaminase